jgi:hypothetical protein
LARHELRRALDARQWVAQVVRRGEQDLFLRLLHRLHEHGNANTHRAVNGIIQQQLGC